MKKETYAGSGVQIDKAESFVERIKAKALRPAHGGMWKAAGGYAAVYPFTGDLGVAVTTDGVGTKLLVAHELKQYNTIGIDLVAMVANDLICVGATPTLFLDYYAVGHLEDELSDALIEGIVEGCDRAGMILAGGETAEMPGLYQKGHYDLAGFAVGHVTASELITGEAVKPGQKLIGVSSSGIHSNGLSLARRVVTQDNWHMLLEPTAIYAKATVQALAKCSSKIKGLAHITGGGWRNLLRLNDRVGFHITCLPDRPEVFKIISRSVEEEEMFKTFNMGMGLAVISEPEICPEIIHIFESAGHLAGVLGEVTDEAGTIKFDAYKFILRDKHS
jgi:phosphoribosylformylglycinamidine cyclo-ligase